MIKSNLIAGPVDASKPQLFARDCRARYIAKPANDLLADRSGRSKPKSNSTEYMPCVAVAPPLLPEEAYDQLASVRRWPYLRYCPHTVTADIQ